MRAGNWVAVADVSGRRQPPAMWCISPSGDGRRRARCIPGRIDCPNFGGGVGQCILGASCTWGGLGGRGVGP